MEKIKSFFNGLFFSLKFIFSNDKKYFFLKIFSVGLSNMQIFLFAYINKFILNFLVSTLNGEDKFKELIIYTCILLSSNFLFSLINNLFEYNSAFSIMKITDKLNLKFCRKVSSLDISFFDNPINNNTIRQISSDLQSVINNFNCLINLFFSTVSFSVALSVAFKLDISITILSLLITIPSFVVNNQIKNDDYKLEKELNQTVRRTDYFKGLFLSQWAYKEVNLYNLKNYFTKKYLEQTEMKNKSKQKLLNKNMKREFLLCIVGFILNLTINIYLILVLVFKKLTVGDYQYYTTIINNIKMSTEKVFSSIGDISVLNKRIDNCRDFFSIKPNITDKPGLEPNKKWKKIEFRNVYFKYPNTEKYVLKNISFEIFSNEKIAFAGINGAGKTTLINLLLRFYDPCEGQILLDGINIKEYSLVSYRNLFSTMFQNSNIYELSIKENIAISDIKKMSENNVMKAIDESFCNDFIKKDDLNNFFGKTFDENGMIFSQGQVQKMCAAKTIFRKSSIYILDEPSASMDALSEYNIFNLFNKKSKKGCLILISHRLSNLIDMDKIIFLKNGMISEQGNHKDLYDNCSDYYRLFCMQANKYFKKDEG